MIAKATPKGKSFKAILNYIYNGKLDNRGKIQKKPEVVSYSNNIEIPLNEDDLESLNRLTKDFHNQAKAHKDFDYNKPYVGHHVLSFGKEDMVLLNKSQIADVVNQYIQDMGLRNTQYIAVSHHDTDVFHVHLVFNRCMNNGKIYDDWREKMKATEKAVALNLKYDLPLVGRQVDLAKTSAVWEIRVQHEDIQVLLKDPLLKDMRNLHHFKKVAEKEYRTISEDEKTIEVDGKKYRKNDLEAVFFHNRREKANKDKLKPKKVRYDPKTKRASQGEKKIPDFELKKRKMKEKPTTEKAEHFFKEPILAKSETESTNPYLQENYQNFNYKRAYSDEDEFAPKIRKR
ncbi:relaxase/mobilization nuclease domain-containing protein [Cellulophaga sp. BC115SP]|uniref:relaxase/mobilization nuclease domain-containing protein n=1 Tax=Cellulophaga sp. BC115SP TaxID=2683263 RepID=UPI0014128C2B|nr:relaxase/mobilization nuclease domain-containing protein [Cellulophaga sp. BC115SP]NBB26985.1 relaxase/mobilization nuclease domain-containing protein [Cellulophaga sp. BC115SP]